MTRNGNSIPGFTVAREERDGGRLPGALRPVTFIPGFLDHPLGSVLVTMGGTRVLCVATVEEGVPRFLRGSGSGWLTAEYAMLPAATHSRTPREASRGRQGGRTLEIQRLIGRSLRSVVRLEKLGERTVYLDCDVLQADGGTRTAAITGAFGALVLALEKLRVSGAASGPLPLSGTLAAVSVGVVHGFPLLDLDYREDAAAEVDMNVVMTGDGRFVEVQGTAEGEPFTGEQMTALLDLARGGIGELLSRLDADVFAGRLPALLRGEGR